MTPALLTRMSSRPKPATARSTIARTWSAARDVCLHGLGAPVEPLELGDDLLRGGAARVVVHDEVGALAPESERDRAAEATTRSGHQRYASVQASGRRITAKGERLPELASASELSLWDLWRRNPCLKT